MGTIPASVPDGAPPRQSGDPVTALSIKVRMRQDGLEKEEQ